MSSDGISNSSLPLPQQQPTKLGKLDGKISKHGNVIHRTTSESLRIGGNGDQLVGLPSASVKNANSLAARNAKTSSFQITSVTTAIGIRTPADNGDDSADDLDESHTDDNSRITDHENETPSFSEDTVSKEDVFFSSHDIGSAPVIPTSSQYGLAIVAPSLGGPDGQMISDVHVSVTDSGLNIVGCSSKHDVDMKDMNHRNERFKVVKIESTEPFKRGRWMCMDYLDHTTLQPTNPSGDGASENNIDFENPNIDSPNKTVQTEIHLANVVNANLLSGQSAAAGYPLSASTSPGQTLSQPLNTSSLLGATASISSEVASNTSSHASAPTIPNPTVQNMSSQQVSPVISQNNPVQPQAPPSNSQNSLQHQDSLAGSINPLPMQDVQQIPNLQQQQQQQQVQSQPTQFHGGGSPHPQQQQQHHQGQTLPASVLHNITHSHPNPSHVTTSQPHQAMSMGHMSQSPQLINQPNFTQSQPLQPIATIINPTQSQQPLVIQNSQISAQQQVSIASPVPQSQQISQPNYSPSTGTGVLIPNSANVSNSPNVINGNGVGSAVNVNVDEGVSGVSSGYLSPAGAAGSVPGSVSVGDVTGTQAIESMIEGGSNQSAMTGASTGSSGTGTTEDGVPTEDSERYVFDKFYFYYFSSKTDVTSNVGNIFMNFFFQFYLCYYHDLLSYNSIHFLQYIVDGKYMSTRYCL